MSEPSKLAAPIDEVPAAPPKKKRRKLLLPVIIIATLLVVSGGAGVFYLQRAGAATKSRAAERKAQAAARATDEEKHDGEDSSETAADHKTRSKSDALEPPDDSAVQQVVELQPFIVNLADKDASRYLRLTVSLGISETAEGEGEGKPNTLFTTRVRNAMLGVLTSKTSEEMLSAEGKAALSKELVRVARAASNEPLVEAIYITDFIVQL